MIFELILRTCRYSVIMRFWKKTATTMMTGIIVSTISARCQLMRIMKMTAVTMLMVLHVRSSNPHVMSSATRSVSEVTREMIQPMGVLLK